MPAPTTARTWPACSRARRSRRRWNACSKRIRPDGHVGAKTRQVCCGRRLAMWKEFKAFILKGNVIDLAVGIIIGAAFGKVVDSLVNDVIMPPIGLALGRVDFANLYINLSGQAVCSVA